MWISFLNVCAAIVLHKKVHQTSPVSLVGPCLQTSAPRSSWWPFSDIAPRTAVFLVVWPFVAHLVVLYVQRRRAQRS